MKFMKIFMRPPNCIQKPGLLCNGQGIKTCFIALVLLCMALVGCESMIASKQSTEPAEEPQQAALKKVFAEISELYTLTDDNYRLLMSSKDDSGYTFIIELTKACDICVYARVSSNSVVMTNMWVPPVNYNGQESRR
jgi:hypothetical protein